MDYQLLVWFAVGICFGILFAGLYLDERYQKKCIQANKYNTAWLDEVRKTKALQERLDVYEH